MSGDRTNAWPCVIDLNWSNWTPGVYQSCVLSETLLYDVVSLAHGQGYLVYLVTVMIGGDADYHKEQSKAELKYSDVRRI